MRLDVMQTAAVLVSGVRHQVVQEREVGRFAVVGIGVQCPHRKRPHRVKGAPLRVMACFNVFVLTAGNWLLGKRQFCPGKDCLARFESKADDRPFALWAALSIHMLRICW